MVLARDIRKGFRKYDQKRFPRPIASSVPVNSKHPDTEPENLESSQRGGRLPWSRYALFLLPAIIGLAADLATKAYVFRHYFDPDRAAAKMPQFTHWWIDGIFGIQTSTNPGALFGIGQGHSWFFAIFSLVALTAILVWLFVLKAAWDRWLTFALGLIAGGILGNFYDRIGWGYLPQYPESIKTDVRDWILFRWEGIRIFEPWPNFNIADSLLVAGAIMLFFHAFFLASNPEDNLPT